MTNYVVTALICKTGVLLEDLSLYLNHVNSVIQCKNAIRPNNRPWNLNFIG